MLNTNKEIHISAIDFLCRKKKKKEKRKRKEEKRSNEKRSKEKRREEETRQREENTIRREEKKQKEVKIPLTLPRLVQMQPQQHLSSAVLVRIAFVQVLRLVVLSRAALAIL